MSKAIYCDHCEELFSEENNRRVDVKFHDYNGEVLELDLCNNCHEQLNRWVYGKENLKKEKFTKVEQGEQHG